MLVCDSFHYRLNNMFIRFDSKLYRQIISITMAANGAPLGAVFWRGRVELGPSHHMVSVSLYYHDNVIEAFNYISRYLCIITPILLKHSTIFQDYLNDILNNDNS